MHNVSPGDRAKKGSVMSNAIALRFYVHQPRKHGNVLLFEWLLGQAKQLGIHGGSAFLAIAGYGRHGVIHEQKFFELPEVLPVMVEFIVPSEDADRLLAIVRREGIHCFCTRTPTEVLDVDAASDRQVHRPSE